MYFVDPDGMQGEDWFKNQQGRVVWFDNKSKGLLILMEVNGQM